MPLNFIKKEPLTCSYAGMRFRMAKTGEKEAEKLLVAIWPEPFCFECTEEGKKQFCEFVFSEEGMRSAIAWLNEQYEAQKSIWDSVRTIQIG